MIARPARYIARAVALLLLPLVLASCALTPGKFTSTLTINADRSFAFTYVGEVIALDLGKQLKPVDDKDGKRPADDSPRAERTSAQADDPGADADQERQNAAIATALSREPGYRKVQYLGAGRFLIDYAVRGRLDHAFVWPYNIDAEVIFPFLAVELRPGGAVRVKAPAFAAEGSKQVSQMGPMAGADAASKLDGVFTLDTDAEIVSQNEEGGVQTAAGRKRMVWRATPALKSAPSAVLRLNPLPAF
ncbi:hypothetical protein [Sphingomonas sp.]|uniref:hypothetical protein n=1 Tax=Sphingomonas sp. TaxID=28214 RepID=UPI001DE46A3A|nr:hypothetical protein [Sphingomonas sp.]MBX9796545.1 hypothetical protein [Sphingomonas sp.]